jgi:hypothetical protein
MERQVVEARLVSHHLCEQLPAEVEDAQDVMLDVDVAAHLIQLPKTNDAGLEPWDEVDTREGAVPAVLAGEDMIDPHPSIIVMDPSPKRIVPQTSESSSMKISLDSVMWLVAPVSRTHRPRSPSSASLRLANTC